MKTLYYRTVLDENTNNSNECWSIFKEGLGTINDKSSYPQTFSINNKSITDKVQIAEGFNNLFPNIGIQRSHNVPTSSRCFSSYMPQLQTHSFFLGPLAPSEV